MTPVSTDGRAGAWRPAAALALALAALLAAGPAAAQDRTGLTFVGGLAYEEGGPGESLMESLARADLADERPGRCVWSCERPIPHPADYQAGLSVTGFVGARYRFEGPLSLEAVLSNGARGHTDGYNAEQQRHVVVRYATFLLSTAAGLHLGPLGLEAGPALAMTRWEGTRNAEELGSGPTTVLGGTAAISAGLPLRGVILSLKSGVRAFPTKNLSEMFGLPLEADYRSFYVGVAAVAQD